jgi:hypothetical protein
MRLISRPRHSNLRLPAPRIDLATPPASHAARLSTHAPRAPQSASNKLGRRPASTQTNRQQERRVTAARTQSIGQRGSANLPHHGLDAGMEKLRPSGRAGGGAAALRPRQVEAAAFRPRCGGQAAALRPRQVEAAASRPRCGGQAAALRPRQAAGRQAAASRPRHTPAGAHTPARGRAAQHQVGHRLSSLQPSAESRAPGRTRDAHARATGTRRLRRHVRRRSLRRLRRILRRRPLRRPHPLRRPRRHDLAVALRLDGRLLPGDHVLGDFGPGKADARPTASRSSGLALTAVWRL